MMHEPERDLPAARAWRESLAAWAIPPEILRAAPESPWVFPVELFVTRAEAAGRATTPSNRRALKALPRGGSVLDVGCGAGAASLALAKVAGSLVGVDGSEEMLRAFSEQAARAGVALQAIHGRWPDSADGTPPADVVVCHHVAYNVPDLRAFALRLTDHARARVVMELTLQHPVSRLGPLWMQFHGLPRPEGPTAGDAVAVLEEAGLHPDTEVWKQPRPGGFRNVEDLVLSVRRLLCLTRDRDPEILEALEPRIIERDGLFGFEDRPVMTVWWSGSAEGSGG